MLPLLTNPCGAAQVWVLQQDGTGRDRDGDRDRDRDQGLALTLSLQSLPSAAT